MKMRPGRPHDSRKIPPSVRAAFELVRKDRRQGAHDLAADALSTISGLVRQGSGRSEAELRNRFREVAHALERSQPAMGPFLRWAKEWGALARSRPRTNLHGKAQTWLRQEGDSLRDEIPRLVRVSRQRFPKARLVVTLSRSRSVLSVLRSLPRSRRPERILVLESLPGGEGRIFAAELRGTGLSARMVSDAEYRRSTRFADLVLVGADAVFSDGSVAHKVGTRRLAIAASRAGVPFVVVAGRSKFTGGPPPRRRLPPRFDRTPRRNISEFWTDRGVRRGGRGDGLRLGVPLFSSKGIRRTERSPRTAELTR